MRLFVWIVIIGLTLTASILARDQQDKLQGAWQASYGEKDQEITVTIIFSEGYISTATYQKSPAQFINTWGGSYESSGKSVKVTFEYHTSDSTMVGQTSNVFTLEKGFLKSNEGDLLFVKVDEGQSSDLTNAYLITGRKREGEIRRSTPGARKTMKILSGNRFQWIAYNTDTGDFFGTGGGTYSAQNGVYTENIEFFSRDNGRVGASLTFEYELVESEWHHQGKSSKGDPIFEIWTPRNMLD